MKLKKVGFFLLPIFAVAAISAGYTRIGGSGKHLCKHQFALCTSALCVPMPGDSHKAICFCDVEVGPSMSTVPCDTIQPRKDVNGIYTIFSTYSAKQFQEGKRGMKCPNGTPWTWCLNKKCTIDPSNPKKAVCTCDVKRSGEWITLGGDCNTATCKTGYWSGASMSDVEEGSEFLARTLGLEKPPLKWCPIEK